MRALVLVAVGLVGCGGEMDPELAGRWRAEGIILSGREALAFESEPIAVVTGEMLHLRGVCPVGPGDMLVVGDSATALVCGPLTVGKCTTALARFQMTARVDADSITLSGSGWADGCGQREPIAYLATVSR